MYQRQKRLSLDERIEVAHPGGASRLQSLDCPGGCWKAPGALSLLAQLIEAPVAGKDFKGSSLTYGDMVAVGLREGVYSVKWRTGEKVGTITEESGRFHAIHGQTGEAGSFDSPMEAVEGLAEAD